MEQNQQLITTAGTVNDYNELLIPLPLAVSETAAALIREYRIKCQQFVEALNRLPPQESVGDTPDGNAHTILISHIEMTLDEMFFGQWDTIDYRWQLIANEIVGSILLVVTHPVTGKELRRTGAAAIQIMVDATPDELKPNKDDDKQQAAERRKKKNQWALNPDNKKSNALDMSFPKLKAECTKNAAQSLGKLFGRDLNRKIADQLHPLLRNNTKAEQVIDATKESIKKAVDGSNQRVAAKVI